MSTVPKGEPDSGEKQEAVVTATISRNPTREAAGDGLETSSARTSAGTGPGTELSPKEKQIPVSLSFPC